MSQSYGIDWQPVGYSVTMYDYIYSDGTKCSAKEAFPELFIKKSWRGVGEFMRR